MQTGQNSIAPESSLPQLGQVRWGSAPGPLTQWQRFIPQRLILGPNGSGQVLEVKKRTFINSNSV
jgi:hypothetical protein